MDVTLSLSHRMKRQKYHKRSPIKKPPGQCRVKPRPMPWPTYVTTGNQTRTRWKATAASSRHSKWTNGSDAEQNFEKQAVQDESMTNQGHDYCQLRLPQLGGKYTLTESHKDGSTRTARRRQLITGPNLTSK